MAAGIVNLVIKDGTGKNRNVKFWSDDGTLDGNLAPIHVQDNLIPSEITPVSGTFTATGSSSSFTPSPDRDFNITISGGSATVVVDRSFDGSNWYTVMTDSLRSALPESFSMNETEVGVLYRVRCTSYTSGTVTYRISQ